MRSLSIFYISLCLLICVQCGGGGIGGTGSVAQNGGGIGGTGTPLITSSDVTSTSETSAVTNSDVTNAMAGLSGETLNDIFQGRIESISLQSNTLKLLNQTFSLSANLVITQSNTSKSLNDLNQNMLVLSIGSVSSSGNQLNKIEIDSSITEWMIQSKITDVGSNSIQFNDTEVLSTTSSQIFDISGNTRTVNQLSDFFNTGNTVKATGQLDLGAFIADNLILIKE